MRAIVLVGGFGTRLRPLTLHAPKQMLPVAHLPMIERVVAHLGAHGVTEVILALGYKPDAFIAAYPDGTCAGVALHYAVEPEPLDTAGAIRFAALSGVVEDTVVVVNGDVLTDLDVTALVARHRATGAAATIALTEVDDPSRYGVVPTDDHGLVLGFVEKPPIEEAPTHWINAGTYVLEPSVLAGIAGGRRVSIERETFPALVEAGSLYAMHSTAYWVDAGTPVTYLDVQLDLVAGRFGDAVPAIDPGAHVSDEATVVDSVIMRGATIEAGAVVTASVIGIDAIVERDANVARSVVGPRAIVGAAARLSDLTVVGDDERVAPGSEHHGARLPNAD